MLPYLWLMEPGSGLWFLIVGSKIYKKTLYNYVLSDSPVLIAHLVTYRLMPDIVES